MREAKCLLYVVSKMGEWEVVIFWSVSETTARALDNMKQRIAFFHLSFPVPWKPIF
jgi:hypothetical protein